MSVESENLYRLELLEKYRTAFGKLFRYIPWLIDKQGTEMTHYYQQDGKSISLPIMVYDQTLLALVKELQATGLMDRNYRYVLSRNNLKTMMDEKKYIQTVELKNVEDIFAIIAKYVLGGMTKGSLWNDAVVNGLFLDAFVKVKALLEVYDKPLA